MYEVIFFEGIFNKEYENNPEQYFSGNVLKLGEKISFFPILKSCETTCFPAFYCYLKKPSHIFTTGLCHAYQKKLGSDYKKIIQTKNANLSNLLLHKYWKCLIQQES